MFLFGLWRTLWEPIILKGQSRKWGTTLLGINSNPCYKHGYVMNWNIWNDGWNTGFLLRQTTRWRNPKMERKTKEQVIGNLEQRKNSVKQLVNQHFWHRLLRWGMRKINSPLLVFALTCVNEDLISLIIWKKTRTEYCGIRTLNSWNGNMLNSCGT